MSQVPMRRAKKKRLKQCTIMTMMLSPLMLFLLQIFQLHSDSLLEEPPAGHYTMHAVRHQSQQRPGLNTIMTSKGEMFGDPQFLLDVAIVGFPKCGTTALQDWLSQHPQVKLLPGEPFPLMYRKPYLLVSRLYNELPPDGPLKFVRGYKNPLDIRAQPSITTLAELFPKTLLIVGLRHPVHWFESLYNFKIQNLPGHVNPARWGDPNLLIDECEDWYDGVDCVGTAKGWFHVYLAALGKVPFPPEWREEYPRYLQNVSSTTVVPNPIFLYETNQLKFEDTHNSTTAHYSDQFRKDLQVQLGLDSPLDMAMSRAKPDNSNFNPRQQRRKDRHKIRICNKQYLPVREALMVIARRTSKWVRNDFLKSPDVFVSSPDHFVGLMEKWMTDPCESSQPSSPASGA